MLKALSSVLPGSRRWTSSQRLGAAGGGAGLGDGLLGNLGLGGLGGGNGLGATDEREGAVKDVGGVRDGVGGADLQKTALGHLGLEAVLALDAHVDRLDDEVRGIDVLLRELVLDARATLGLDLALEAALGALLLHGLLGHVGVRDADGAGAHSYDLHVLLL